MDDCQYRTWGNPHQCFGCRSKQDCFNAVAWIGTYNQKVRAGGFGSDLFGSVPSANHFLHAAATANARADPIAELLSNCSIGKSSPAVFSITCKTVSSAPVISASFAAQSQIR